MVLFDERSADAPRDAPLTVAQLAGAIKAALTDALPRKVRVVGEVSNLSDRNHWFFSLKDDAATLRAVMFASAARQVNFPVKDGLEVVATGRVDFYDAQGSVQLYVDRLEPVGQGARELALRELMEELRGLGYFAPEHKKSLPGVPTRIAVVTSRSAAALQDVIDTASRRWPGCELLLVDVRVQGEDAAPQIAAALRCLSQQGERLGIDAVLLTRGGGSIEDLWAFNERAVADAIFDCTLPVVAAIGHETDTTIAELVADLRCATPTQAAMTLVPDRAVLAEQVTQLDRRLRLGLTRNLELARHRLATAAAHRLFQQPGRWVDEHRQKLERLQQRFASTLPRRLTDERRRLDALTRTLDAVSPQRVLERGYSYTLGPDGKLVRCTDQAPAGTKLTTVLQDGRVESTVNGADAVAPPQPRGPKRRRPRNHPPDADESTLFA
jgi:exodeoxyribonuclease VII large subunit